MSARMLLSIDSPTIMRAVDFISQIKHARRLKCLVCSKEVNLGDCSMIVDDNLEALNLVLKFCCLNCKKKKVRFVGAYLVQFQNIKKLLNTFILFDVQNLTKNFVRLILQAFRQKESRIQRHRDIRFANFLQSSLNGTEFFPGNCKKRDMHEYLPFLGKAIHYFIKQLKCFGTFDDWFTKRGRLIDNFSQQKLNYFIKLMREQISIKLDILKDLHYVAVTQDQPVLFQFYCTQAAIVLKNPLYSFVKTKNHERKVHFTIDRREVLYKYPWHSEFQDQNEPSPQMIRIAGPLKRVRPSIFQFKLMVLRSQYVKLGFYFIKRQDFIDDAFYKEGMAPIQVLFLVQVNKQLDNNKMKVGPEILRSMHQSYCSSNDKSMMSIQMEQTKPFYQEAPYFQEQLDSQGEELLLYPQTRRQLKPVLVHDEDMIKMIYETSSNSFVMVNQTANCEVFRKRLYGNRSYKLKNMVVFPYVTLFSSDCAVQLALDMYLT